MKTLLTSVWRSLMRATYRKHDPFLVYSITSFNSGGGWNARGHNAHIAAGNVNPSRVALSPTDVLGFY
ncbi:MAG: hypothetical protein DMF44_14655 [Verrucomicrobia bacterium]|nr:MAG: hypothetical protein DMF44_14655 [Verrucomicrobiota bacterium]